MLHNNHTLRLHNLAHSWSIQSGAAAPYIAPWTYSRVKFRQRRGSERVWAFGERITISMLRRRKSSFSGDLRASFCHPRQGCLALTPETIYLPHFYCRGFCQGGPKSVPCGTITKHLCIRWECTSVKIRRKMKLGPSLPLVEGRKWEDMRGAPSHETFAVQYARFSEFTFTN